MVLQLHTPDGPVALGIPCDRVIELVDHCALAGARSEEILRSGLDLRCRATWWSSAVDLASREFILALTFGRGGTWSFALSEPMAKALLKTLSLHFDKDRTAPADDPTRAADATALAPGFV